MIESRQSMKIGIMQPYLLPYIGYYQLIGAVDKFVVYDNIKYTKKGWINRNRLLSNNVAATFTLPLLSDSDAAEIGERQIAADFHASSLLNRFRGAYAKSLYFKETFRVLEEIFESENKNLFEFILHSLKVMLRHLGIDTPIIVSSSVPANHSLKSEDRVIDICRTLGATSYINPIGGSALYSSKTFSDQGIQLKFLYSKPLEYRQFGEAFIPNLSIVDVLMFNSVEEVAAIISSGYYWGHNV
jgi:hypothetical protein